MAKNIFGKMRSIDKPYAVYRSPMGKHFKSLISNS